MSQSRILVVEDDSGLREALIDTLMMAGYQCEEAQSGEQALLLLAEQAIDLVISDVQMDGISGLDLLQSIKVKYPKLPVLLMTAYARIDSAVQAMRQGAIDYIAKPFSPEVLLNQVGRYAPAQKVETCQPVFGDPSTEKLLRLADKVAQTEASVMICGPSGAGKEVLARYIHDNSPRCDEPFVAINCAAIPENMLEATLFGYEKGAFTGAVQGCPGKFEQAQNGTILLDEISEMELALQAKLLRVLQEREVERLGSRKMIKLNVRVLATSNRNLKQYVANGEFREDLYYRLNVFPLTWKPLTQRPGDILPLANHLLSKHGQLAGRADVRLTLAAQQKLLSYSWPGNVRELDNVIQRAIILAVDEVDDSHLLIEGELTSSSIDAATSIDVVESTPPVLGSELKQQENQIIIEMLKNCRGKRKEVAERLGISPRTLRYKLARMREDGIKLPA
ncbi:sigma-54-dependent transcriptional regulator [Celerinatantimonas yamalensis]|uniref:Sigma-54 dependent transcriptional regulator n=1 Tax=Celerinatantimonas yamalensis TaxID=559956 RepID=A0ABW9G779_9GAMM